MLLANFEMALVQDIKFVGWEKNDKGKFCPKYVDLSKTMDSKKLVIYKLNGEFLTSII